MARSDEAVDVCVIGTGAGGGRAIDALVRSGARVVALDRGGLVTARDFEDAGVRPVVPGGLATESPSHTYRADAAEPAVPIRAVAAPHTVGGAMLRWGGRSWRLRPEALRTRSIVGETAGAALEDWPLEASDLERSYDEVERLYGVAGSSRSNPKGARIREAYPNPQHPPRGASVAIARGASQLGLHPYPTPVAINSTPHAGRPACSHAGTCDGYGCPIGAKATTLSVVLSGALRTGRLDLRPSTRAVEIPLDAQGRAMGVRTIDWKGREGFVRARHVVLAAGGIESAALLLRSTGGSFPNGLANRSGLVGKNLMFQMTARALGLLDRPAFGFTGMSSHIALDDFQESDAKRGFALGGVVFEHNAWTAEPTAWAHLASRGHPQADGSWGPPLAEFVASFPHGVMISAVLEDLPMPTNTVDLDPDHRDAAAMALPRITHAQHPNDLAMHAWFDQRLLEIVSAAGTTEAWNSRVPGLTSISAQHPMSGPMLGHALGTCRMGTSPDESVTDAWGRSHDVRNLWVADGSVFPTSTGYEPTLTILAHASRVAERIASVSRTRDTSS